MKKFVFLYVALMILPAVLVAVNSHLSDAGIVALILGFLMTVILGLRNPFTQHKHGIFAQWTAPNEFIKMKLSEKEKIYFGFALSLVMGGLIALIVQIKVINY